MYSIIIEERDLPTIIEERDLPTTADIGRFIPESELLEWHANLVKKNVVPKDDNLFGPYQTQHSEGSELVAYFNADQNKPLRCEIKGSKWRTGFAGGKQPVYVVSRNGDLAEILWISAHEEEEDITTWKVVQDWMVYSRLSSIMQSQQ